VEAKEERAGRDMVPEGLGPGSVLAAEEWAEAAEELARAREVPEEAEADPAAKVCGEREAADPGRAEVREAEGKAEVAARAGVREAEAREDRE
jgi:hypothetical protein